MTGQRKMLLSPTSDSNSAFAVTQLLFSWSYSIFVILFFNTIYVLEKVILLLFHFILFLLNMDQIVKVKVSLFLKLKKYRM